jgi:hypothetical protein
MKKQKGAAVTATVAKWYTGVAATEYIRIHTIVWDNKTSNAGNNLLFEDEDGSNDFFRKSLDIAGDTGYVYFPDGIQLPKGKDLKVTLSGGTTNCWIWVGGEGRIANQ